MLLPERHVVLLGIEGRVVVVHVQKLDLDGGCRAQTTCIAGETTKKRSKTGTHLHDKFSHMDDMFTQGNDTLKPGMSTGQEWAGARRVGWSGGGGLDWS